MKFRRKPIIVKAEQFIESKLPTPDGVTTADNYPYSFITYEFAGRALQNGDWILQEEFGDYYVTSDKDFKKNYEKVEE